MKALFTAFLITFSLSTFATEGCDESGYNSDGISCERAAADGQWDAEQAEFDRPNP